MANLWSMRQTCRIGRLQVENFIIKFFTDSKSHIADSLVLFPFIRKVEKVIELYEGYMDLYVKKIGAWYVKGWLDNNNNKNNNNNKYIILTEEKNSILKNLFYLKSTF